MFSREITIFCDHCSNWYRFDMGVFTLRSARKWLRDHGWRYVAKDFADFCPDCVKNGTLMPKKGDN